MNNYNDTMGKPHVTPAQWEQRRYEIAKAVLSSLIPLSVEVGHPMQKRVNWAISYADELIKQLKGNGTLDGNNQ